MATQSTLPATRLNLDRLVNDYVQQLNVTLRGFTASADFAFLERFVPNSDPTENLLDLVDLAREAGLSGLAVELSNDTLNRIDLTRLSGLLVRQAPIAPDTVELQFALSAELPDRRIGPASSVPVPATPRSRLEIPVAEAGTIPEPASTTSVHPTYRKKLEGSSTSRVHAAEVVAGPGEVRVSATSRNVELMAVVRGMQATVVRSGFTGELSALEWGLFEEVCRKMEGKPLLEAANHVMIEVERALRDPAIPHPVRGLITPENADPIFALPQRLVRQLVDVYQSQTKTPLKPLMYDRPASTRWRGLTADQRQQDVAAALQKAGAEPHMTLHGVDGLKRVVVQFISDLRPLEKQALLVRLEQVLRETVEPTLFMVAEARVDKNILRLPQRKLAK